MDTAIIDLGRVSQQVLEMLRTSAENIRQNHLNAGQKASGVTANSIRAEVEVGAASIRGIIWGRAPFTDLEEGRGPGKGPANFYRIILDWMHFKGIHGTPIPYKRKESPRWSPKYTPEDRGDRTLAYFISRKIEEEGTRLYRGDIQRQDIYSSEIEDVVDRIGTTMLSIFATTAEHIHTKHDNIR